MHRLTAAMIGSLALALAAITRVDRVLVDLYRSAIGARREDHGSIPAKTDPVAAERATIERNPFAAFGRSRAEIAAILGAPRFADAASDYFKASDGTILRLTCDADIVRGFSRPGSRPTQEKPRWAAITVGTSWIDVLEQFGLPEYSEAGCWYYFGVPSRKDVRVHFAWGRVVGCEEIPAFWSIPNE